MISFPLATLFSNSCELLFQYITLGYRKRILPGSPSTITETTSYQFSSSETSSSCSLLQLFSPAMVLHHPDTTPDDSIKKTSEPLSIFHHQHRCKDKDKAKRHQLVCDRVNSWLSPYHSPVQADIRVSCAILKNYLQVIKDIVHMEGYHYKRNLLVPTLIYADKYVEKCGQVGDLRDAFLLLLISSMVTVKMWEDWGISAGVVEEAVGISRKELTLMERRFLSALDYSLFLSDQDIQDFKSRFTETKI